MANKRQKPIVIKLSFEKINKKRQPVNLSKTSRHTAGVHQRATDPFEKFLMFFLLSQPDSSSLKASSKLTMTTVRPKMKKKVKSFHIFLLLCLG